MSASDGPSSRSLIAETFKQEPHQPMQCAGEKSPMAASGTLLCNL